MTWLSGDKAWHPSVRDTAAEATVVVLVSYLLDLLPGDIHRLLVIFI